MCFALCALLKRYKADYSKYEPLVVAHKTNPKMLYCTLTNTELNRIPKEVEAHVKGKRFLNRKAEMEGLKQGQRQPATAGSDDEFWVSHESPSFLWPGGGGGRLLLQCHSGYFGTQCLVRWILHM